MSLTSVILNVEAHIANVILNRPAAGNAINETLAREMEKVCDGINQDSNIYVVTLTGAGNKAFCLGGEAETGESSYHPAEAIAGIRCPVIVAINGDAIGSGLEVALGGDIRLASEKARFGLSQLADGRLPADGGTQRLPRIVGRGKALEMLMTAEMVSAAEALEMGLVSKVVPAEKLAAEAAELAGIIAKKGPVALKYIKEAVNKGMDMTLEQGLRLEADLYFLLHTTADRTEGINAFRQKRPPNFKGK